MELGAPILDVLTQKVGDSGRARIILAGGAVGEYKKYIQKNGLTQDEYISQLNITDYEKYLCDNMEVTLAYKETNNESMTPFKGCKLL